MSLAVVAVCLCACCCGCACVPLLLLWRCVYVPIWYRLRVGRLLLFERRLDFSDIVFIDKLAVADELTAVLDELCLGGGRRKGRWCESCVSDVCVAACAAARLENAVAARLLSLLPALHISRRSHRGHQRARPSPYLYAQCIMRRPTRLKRASPPLLCRCGGEGPVGRRTRRERERKVEKGRGGW